MVVRTRNVDPILPRSGLIDIEVDGHDFSLFLCDLQTRSEKIEGIGV